MGPIMAFSAKLDSQQGGKALDPNKQFLSSLKRPSLISERSLIQVKRLAKQKKCGGDSADRATLLKPD